MRRAALLVATASLVALVAPAQARDHPRDRTEREAEDTGNGFHRYYGSEYGGGDGDFAPERVPERQDRRDRSRRHGERDARRTPPPPPV